MQTNSISNKKLLHSIWLILLLSAVGVTKMNALSFTVGNLNYSVNSDGMSVRVTGHVNGTSATGVLIIPESVTYEETEYSVTKISYEAFSGCSGLTSVTFGNSVASIGEDAFWNCTGLTSVNYLGDIAQWCNITFDHDGPTSNPLFYAHNLYVYNELVTNLVIPETVTRIKDYAFYGCSSFASVGIPNSVLYIDECAFCKCTGLISVTIPNSVLTIDEGAFYGCTNLASVILSNSISIIDEMVFYGCTALTSINIPSSVTTIKDYAFSGCSSMGSLFISNSVTSIKNGAFGNCSSLTSLFIPNSVASIAVSAFSGCTGIEQIVVESGNPAYDSRDNCNAVIQTYGNTLKIGCKSTIIPSSVFSIGNSAFSGCTGLTSINIPNSVTSIGVGAFSNCIGLTSLTIPNSVTSIGEDAFLCCSGLTSLVLPNSVSHIDNYAFNSCYNLNSITIYRESPPYLSMPNFNYVPRDIPIYIPNGTTSAYQSANGWSEFTNFIEQIESCPIAILALAIPPEGGTIFGAGEYDEGSTCTLIATPNEGYSFVNWTENYYGEMCTEPSYTFEVTGYRCLTAIFVPDGDSSAGVLPGVFSVGQNAYVNFSKGNLQYIASASTPYWKFAEHQWDCFGNNGQGEFNSYFIDRDLFGWGTSGYNHGAICYTPSAYFQDGRKYHAYGQWSANLNDQTGMADWGYNAILNGGNVENEWHTLTLGEWGYIFNTRTTTSGIRYAKAQVNSINGMILLPDDWDISYYSLNETNTADANYSSNVITSSQWSSLEQHGAVFLPAAGCRNNYDPLSNPLINNVGNSGYYWSSSSGNPYEAYSMTFYNGNYGGNSCNRYWGLSVRLVKTYQPTTFSIEAYPEPEEGGSIGGAGIYIEGTICTLTATPNEGYTFVNWTEDCEEVSDEATYSFVVTGDRILVANFVESVTTAEQTITLSAGWNWVSFNAEITMDDLQAALLSAYPSPGMNALVVKSKGNGQTAYNPVAQRWVGSLTTLDLSLMYMVKVPTANEITVEGMPINPAEQPVTIAPGVNWIAFPLSESMTVTEAFVGFPANADVVKAKTDGQAQWNNTANSWIGSLTTLKSGKGYIYKSNTNEDRTFVFPSDE